MKLSESPDGFGSIRTLERRQLVVDWHGHGTLFYRMSKDELKKVLAGARKTTVKQVQVSIYDKEIVETVSFPVTRPNKGLEIGCEVFTAEDVRKMKQWVKEGK